MNVELNTNELVCIRDVLWQAEERARERLLKASLSNESARVIGQNAHLCALEVQQYKRMRDKFNACVSRALREEVK